MYIYIHIPFCDSICAYCDFCKLKYNKEWIDTYLDSLKNEIESYYKGEKIRTLYIGGGTPTTLTAEQLEKLSNPFFTTRTTRNVGLGIPLFKQTLEQTGGFLKITSKEKVGTTFHALMYKNHIDAIPLGDIGETFFVLVINPYNIDVHLEMIFENSDKEEFVIDTKDIKEVLDGVPLTEPSVTSWIKEYISEGLK